MLLIRRFEERVLELFGEGLIKGTAHPCVGQEAVAVGACAALRPGDYVTSTHRGHGHLLAKGGDPRRLMAELFGKATGYSRGRGGSQHVAAFDLGFLGSNGITGGGLPIATGAALALKMRRESRIVLAFFGDGATGQGTFHESLNLGAVWKLPIVYLCENNLYAMGTHIRYTCPVPNVADRAAAYGMPGVIVDGNDVLAVREVVREAVDRARRGEGPTLIEAKTYRLLGHSKGDTDRPYRTREEEAQWWARDPIRRCRERLQQANLLEPARDEALRAEVEREIEAAVQFARESPDPDPAVDLGEVFRPG
ncbi:MAG TPA: thiamine pyrophosphate-dependent dehydrogenase E1 component subunit alpha [Armatimonadetes bacterium]|nr:thiamine pyrophosphate-dependent dehydrogenase E1 component subunit alpha [Armatimonadota bacterium]